MFSSIVSVIPSFCYEGNLSQFINRWRHLLPIHIRLLVFVLRAMNSVMESPAHSLWYQLWHLPLHPTVIFTKDLRMFWSLPPIYVSVFQVFSFLWAFRQKPCTVFCPVSCVICSCIVISKFEFKFLIFSFSVLLTVKKMCGNSAVMWIHNTDLSCNVVTLYLCPMIVTLCHCGGKQLAKKRKSWLYGWEAS